MHLAARMRLVVVVSFGALIALALALPHAALATGGACVIDASDPDGKSGMMQVTGQPGEKNGIAVASKGKAEEIRAIDKGVDGGGSPIPFDFTCGPLLDAPIDTLNASLGAERDIFFAYAPVHRLRADGYKRLYRTVDVTASGGPQADLLFGHAGVDVLRGEGGPDAMFGAKGDDSLRGGNRFDLLWGRGGSDVYKGQRGSDLILARDRDVDVVHCGGGFDSVIANPEDEIAPDCEDATTRKALTARQQRPIEKLKLRLKR